MKICVVKRYCIFLLLSGCFACGASQRNATHPSRMIFGGLTVATSFSPDNDGNDDTWSIQNFETHGSVFVYSIYGELVYKSQGEYVPWDGTYKGKKVSAGNYYYVIDLGKGLRNPDGWVALRR